jgi:hypothetical protein
LSAAGGGAVHEIAAGSTPTLHELIGRIG